MSDPEKFERSCVLPQDAGACFDWHLAPGAFRRLKAPWQDVRVLEDDGEVVNGSRVTFAVKKGPLRFRWVAQHEGVERPREFRDRQISGPFSHWLHRHLFEPGPRDGSCQLEDQIAYRLPLGFLGRIAQGGAVRSDLDRLFRYRHAITRFDLQRHREHAERPRLRVAISGASGMLGSVLSAFLTTGGHEVVPISRRVPFGSRDAIAWDTREQRIDAEALRGIDAVVHLAGENIASGRWSDARMERIRSSRIEGTRAVVRAIKESGAEGPKILTCASAVGIFGDRGDEELPDDAKPGEGFLAELGVAWENEAFEAENAGVRVCTTRFGLVLSPCGGALAKMLPAFRLGAAGRLGSGRHFTSWISLEDAIGMIHETLMSETWRGAYNACAPQTVRNLEFTKTLGRVLKRPTIIPAPAFALRAALGSMADEALLASTRAVPRRALESNFQFLFPELEPALRFSLGRMLPTELDS